MNPEHRGPDELEAKISALLLGELEAAEAAEVRATIAADPELRRLRDRLQQTIGLVREATVRQPEIASASPLAVQLSEPRRAELLKRFKVLPLAEQAAKGPTRSWWVPIAAAAGLTVTLSLLSLSLGSWDRARGAMGFEMAGYAGESVSAGQSWSDQPQPQRTYLSMRKLSALEEEVNRMREQEKYAVPSGGSSPLLDATPIGLPTELTAMRPRSQGIAFPPVPPVPLEAPARSAGRARFSDGLVVTEDERVSTAWGDYDSDGQLHLDVSNGSVGRGEGLTGLSDPSGSTRERLGEAEFTRLQAKPAAAGEERYGAFEKRRSLPEGIDNSGFDRAPNAVALHSLDIKELMAKAPVADSLDRGGIVLGDRPTLGRQFAVAPEPLPMTAAGAAVGGVVNARGRQDEASQAGETILGQPRQRFEEADKLGAVTDFNISIARGSGSVGGNHFNLPAVSLAGGAANGSFGGGLGLMTNRAMVGGFGGGAIGGGGGGEPELLERVAALPEPQPEVLTAEQRVSTFSLNVSDVSFKLAAASLNNGLLPEPATVRTEEFINALDYRDPEPAGDAAVALNWERGRYPFAHNRELLRFSVRTAAQGRALDRPLNLVLLLDNSGSMERADRVGIIREAMRVLAAQIQPQDRVSVVSFARAPRLWVDGLAGTEAEGLPGLVGELTPEGGTNLEAALELAYAAAFRHFVVGGVNRVVLLTDGAANLGVVEPRLLQGQVESNRLKGIALDCFGIGWEGYNDDLLETLSRHGDGRYGFVNSPEEAATGFADQLAGALEVAAANVKVQVEFNPARVTAYRQVGYAKHQLTEEQFRDNTVDAAEIGAAESGNVLYVAQVEPQGQGPIGVVRARYQDPSTGEYHEQEWGLPYLGPAPELAASSATLRLAGSAAAFAEWLARSPFAAEVSPDRLLRLLEGVPEAFDLDPRPEQLRTMLRQSIVLGGGSLN